MDRLWLGIALFCGSFPLSATDQFSAGWAQVLQIEQEQGRPWPRLSDLMPTLTLSEAYDIQRALLGVINPARASAGYKFAVSRQGTEGNQRHAVTAALPAQGQRPNRATLRLSGSGSRAATVSLGFVLRSNITRQMQSADDLRTYIQHAVPVLELPKGRFERAEQAFLVDWIAVNFGMHEWLAGRPLPVHFLYNAEPLELSLMRDAAPLSTITAFALEASLQRLLPQLNELQTRATLLAAGQLLVVDTLLELNELVHGRYELRLGAQPVMSFQVVSPPGPSNGRR